MIISIINVALILIGIYMLITCIYEYNKNKDTYSKVDFHLDIVMSLIYIVLGVLLLFRMIDNTYLILIFILIKCVETFVKSKVH